jgi:hypothetical protein
MTTKNITASEISESFRSASIENLQEMTLHTKGVLREIIFNYINRIKVKKGIRTIGCSYEKYSGHDYESSPNFRP